ncbi:MAG: NAD(P)/FAD-dependent oxidoreductase [Ignavibacteriaceae bacterium]
MKSNLIVIGGGAAGFFGAINYAENNPNSEIIILEKSDKVLRKVKISGGGRCNVTNAISDPFELSKFYPRGGKELISAFNKFTSSDTIKWFEDKGVKLKTENDNRVFPVTDNSQTIIDCFLNEASKLNIKILKKINAQKFERTENNNWKIITENDEIFETEKLLIASGSSEKIWKILNDIGHSIVDPIPSLFTFNIKDKRLIDLAGISVPYVEIKINEINFKAAGPLLITHWGLSGPVVLKLSAWAARELHKKNYNFKIEINFALEFNSGQMLNKLLKIKNELASKNISSGSLFNIPLRFWEKIIDHSGINSSIKWNNLSKKNLQILADELTNSKFNVTGKSTFKEEFVTSGGVSLKEIDFKTMQSKILPNIYFAGEVIDIDGITGGFNFQSAWTTAWIAANSM